MTKRPATTNKNSGDLKYQPLQRGAPPVNDGIKKPLFSSSSELKLPVRGNMDTAAGSLKIYKDRDGIPVLYDKTAQDRGELNRDAIKVLWHDVFAPITLIKGYTSTLRRFNDFITEKQKEEYLQGIDTATKRLVFVLEKLRYITGLEEMRNMSMQPTILVDLLRKICSDTQERAAKHIISFHPRTSIPKINVNRESIEQVLHNLLDNAIKYSPNGGDIEVEVLMVKNRQELDRFFPDAPRLKLPSVIVSVVDNGIGIPDAERDKIFEKFYRVNSQLTRSVPGLGLGLYINKVNVEAHGGCIWAMKRLQEGSIVSFSLPVS
jgi:signal transduction histidine kinase